MTTPKRNGRTPRQKALPPGNGTNGSNGSNEAVDLGSVTDLDDGETFVLRRAEAHGAGLPTTEHLSADEVAAREKRNARSFRAALRSYGELRQTRTA